MRDVVKGSFRFVGIVAGSFLLAYFFPPFQSYGSESLWHILSIFSILLAFLIERALRRRASLSESISTDLSRLRRLWHLSEFVSNAVWRKKFQAALIMYQRRMGEYFLSNREALSYFRTVTHLVYRFVPKKKQEEVLMHELLEITRELALERQTIEEELAGGLSGIAWMNVAVAVAFIAFLSLSIRYVDGSSVFGSGATIAYLFLVVDFLVSANTISREKLRSYAQRYHQNIVKSRQESHEDL